jgi:Carboxypeptidase regulatory-like domain
MAHGKRLALFAFACAAVLFAARDARACSCAAEPSVLDSFEWAEVVVVTRVLSVEKVYAKGAAERGGYFVRSTRMIVEKVFKGDPRPGEEMSFGQGGANCVWTFGEGDVGRQYLFYLHGGDKGQKVWYAGTCGRSSGLGGAADDLLYLNNMSKARGRTRLSGTLQFGLGEEGDPSAANRELRIIGANKTYKVKTDENGVYEIYDLPAGQYLVEPEATPGWKVNVLMLGYSASYAGGEEDRSRKKMEKIPVAVQAGRHAALDLYFGIDTAIRGKVYDPGGNPLEGVCLHLSPAADANPQFYAADCTDAQGAFSIEDVSPGRYFVVANHDGKISSRQPFKTIYYPNAFDREKASVVSVGAGDVVDGVNVYVPAAEEVVTVEGVFLYSDGRPVAEENVVFEAEKAGAGVDGGARARTDARGRFSIRILRGLRGKLRGEMYAHEGEFGNCPKLESVIKEGGRTSAEIKTPAVEILAEPGLAEPELRYPFPGCKAK